MNTNLFIYRFCFIVLLLKLLVFRLQPQSKFKICRNESFNVTIPTLANKIVRNRELLIILRPESLTFHSYEILLELFTCRAPTGVGLGIAIIQRNGLRTVHFCICISGVKILVRKHSGKGTTCPSCMLYLVIRQLM